MVAGFMWGRAILSMAMLLFWIVSLTGYRPKDWLGDRWWLLGVFWVMMYVISFFWSDNVGYWSERVQVKLPFLMLPMAFALLPALSLKSLKAFTWSLALLLLLGCSYSYYFLWKDTDQIINGYFTSKVMPTPAYRDHIRYSIFITWFCVWCIYVFPLFRGKEKWLLAFSIFFFVVYIHVLAVKSGLLMFYLFILAYGIYYLLKRKWLVGISLIGAIGIIILTAFKTFPSFEYKIAYLKYTYEEYHRTGMSGQFSDMGRVISYGLARDICRESPWLGVGAGDILDVMKEKYNEKYPAVPEEQRLVPHNQLLVVAVGCGIPALILFVTWLWYPVSNIKRTRSGFFMLTTWFILLVALLVEPMLEVQLGVFVYLFCLLFVWRTGDVVQKYYKASTGT